MDIVVSHTAALAAYRAGTDASPADPRLPDKAPGAAEVRAWAASEPLSAEPGLPLTLLVGKESARTENSAFRALYSAPLPEGSLRGIRPGVRIVSTEQLLVQMARIATTVELAMLICEFCGHYAVRPDASIGVVQRGRPLTSMERVEAHAKRLSGVPGIAKLREALALSFDGSGSPMESKLAARVSWPRAKGGYGVPVLSMNSELEVGRISRNLRTAKVRKPDLLFTLPSEGAPGLCLDYHGDVHRAEGRPELDAARMNELLAFGLRPYTLWHDQYQGTAYLDGLVDGVIRRSLGMPSHRTSTRRATLELARREALLAELNAVDGMSWGTSGSGAEALHAREAVDEARSRL